MAVKLTAIMTLAIGLGPTLAMFTIAHAALVRPLPYPQPERIVTPFTRHLKTREQLPPANGMVAERIAAMASFDRVARMSVAGGLLLGGSDPVNTFGSAVETPFFEIFGMPIAAGRTPAREGEAVISWRLWDQRFGRRDDVLGRVIRYRDDRVTVVGVANTSYDFPYRNDIWYVKAPAALATEPYADLALRLKPGVSVDDARAELATIRAGIDRDDPRALADSELVLSTFMEAETEPLRLPLLTLLGAASLVILIACANVANLLFASGERRRHEMAVRRAMGASHARLLWQLLREAGTLAIAGVVAGAMLAAWTVPLILSYAPDVFTRRTDFTPSWGVAAFTIALAGVVTIGFGMAPALRLARVPAMASLRASSPSLAGRPSRLMSAAITIQVAVAMILVIGTALMLTSLARLVDGLSVVPAEELLTVRLVDGLSVVPAEELMTVRLDVGQTAAAAPAIAAAVLERVVQPSQGRVVAASGLPLHPVLPVAVAWEGQQPSRHIPTRSISTGYFAAVGQAIVRGRDFSVADAGAPAVAIVSETLARRVQDATGHDAVGEMLHVTLPGGPRPLSIVGVAADVRAAVNRPPDAEVYVPLAQVSHTTRGSWIYVIGPAAQSAALAAEVKRLLREISLETPLSDASRLDQLFAERLLAPRFRLRLMAALGIIALALAISGVFAVVVYSVARRTRELAVRIAIGATPADVARSVMRSVVAPIALGLLIGLAAATQLAPLVRDMLFYEVSPTSATIYLSAAVAFICAAVAATAIPLHRLWRLNPAEALRAD